MKKIFFPFFISALMFVTGCEDTFYDAYNDLTGPVDSVYVKESTTIMETMTEQLEAEVYPELTPNKTVVWSRSNGSGAVTVDPASGLVTGISAGTATVTATSADGLHSASCEVTIISLTPPDVPGVLTFGKGPHTIIISWAAVPRATSYEVSYRLASDSVSPYTVADNNVTGTTYTITGLVPGESYNVKVKSINTAGVSDFNDPAAGIAGYALRDTGPGGGLVFYDAGSIQVDATYGNWRYMEVSVPPDQITGLEWGGYGYALTNLNSAIGLGSINTDWIVLWLNTSPHIELFRAAQWCNLTTTGGYTWFLPSLDELNKIYVNLKSGTDENNVTYSPVGSFDSAFYWSSTEYNSSFAYSINFSNGAFVYQPKNCVPPGTSSFRVRAAHRFL